MKAFRVKYVHNAMLEVDKAFNDSLSYAKSINIPVLITFMRFRRKATKDKYSYGLGYKYIKPYFKLIDSIKKEYCNLFKSYGCFICDEKDKGCPDCMNCAKLTYDISKTNIYEINLSSSGYCKFHCPDCYARDNATRCGISFDTIKQNMKQTGHIKKSYYKYPFKMKGVISC